MSQISYPSCGGKVDRVAFARGRSVKRGAPFASEPSACSCVRWDQASLILVDLTSKHVPGKLAAHALDRAPITTNYNTVPLDPFKPFDPSGLRLGTPAVTTREMTASEMNPIARWIDEGVERGVTKRQSTASPPR